MGPRNSEAPPWERQTPPYPLTWSRTGNGFPRQSRLLLPKEFENVLRKREVLINAPPLQVLAVKNSLDMPRLGLVIGKRVAPRAVDRNRVRRLVRESFRKHAAELPPLDVVVMQKQRATRDQRTLVTELLENVWRRLAAGKTVGKAQGQDEEKAQGNVQGITKTP